MKELLIGIGFLSILASGIAQAAPDCSTLKARWYSQYIRDFGIAWNTDSFDCPGGEGKLALAFYDLETIDFTPNESGYAPDFYALTSGLVDKVRFDDSCTAIARASGSRITICPPFLSDSREDRASTIVHESRHLQSGDDGHVTCVGGAYNGRSGACDQKFHNGNWGGSGFNADVFYHNWVLQAGKRNELSRSVLQSDINSFVPDRFNVITASEIREWRKD